MWSGGVLNQICLNWRGSYKDRDARSLGKYFSALHGWSGTLRVLSGRLGRYWIFGYRGIVEKNSTVFINTAVLRRQLRHQVAATKDRPSLAMQKRKAFSVIRKMASCQTSLFPPKLLIWGTSVTAWIIVYFFFYSKTKRSLLKITKP